MKQTTVLAFALILLAGCAKTGRAWLVDNSPSWDMLIEGIKFYIAAPAIAFLLWYWLRDNWRFLRNPTRLKVGIAVIFFFLIFCGVYRGWKHIHTPCTFEELANNACPNYKTKPNWQLDKEPVPNL